MNTSSAKKSLFQDKKKLLLIVAIVIGALLIIQITISLFLDPFVANRLKSSFHQSTREAYVIEFDDLDLSIINREIALENISIHPDSSHLDSTNLWQKVPIKGQFQSKNFSISGIGIFDLLFEKQLHIKTISLRNPEIFLERVQSHQETDSASSNQRKSLNLLIYKAVNTHLKSLSVNQFEITGASLNLREFGKKQGIFALKNGALQLRDINVDSVSAQRKEFFITNKLSWNAEEVAWNLPNDLYTIKAYALGGSSFDQTAFIDSLRLEPLYPKYEFSKTIGHEIDRIDLMIEHLGLQKVNFDSLLNARKLIAETFFIENAKLEILRDKRLPGGATTIKPLPYVTFQEMKFPVKIDTLFISDSYISYSEHKPQVSDPGTVTFEDLKATFTNVSNYVSNSEENNSISLEAQAKVMGSGLLSANFSFPVGDTSGRHTIYGTLGSMSVKDLNPILEKVGFVRAENGTINSMNFSMELNKRKATGSLTLNYQDLDLKMLEQDKVKEGETKEVVSFIANTFIIKKNNNEEPLRDGAIEVERDEEKSVFNYWWKSLLSGLKDNIGL